MARLRHARLADVAHADEAVGELLPMLNQRRFQKLDATRESLFASLDSPALRRFPRRRGAGRRGALLRFTLTITLKLTGTAAACSTPWWAQGSRRA